MSEIELKPCPCCGGSMRKLGRKSVTCLDPEKGCGVCLQVFDIESWNSRDLESVAKPYTVLARDLEDQRDAAYKRIEELEPLLEDALRALEHADFLLGPENNSVPLSNQCLFRRGVIRRANEL